MNGRRKQVRLGASIGLLLMGQGIVGCASQTRSMDVVQKAELERRAWGILRMGVRFVSNPAVRAQSVEALRYSAKGEALPWIRSSLSDAHPAVRFAGCLAAGELQDSGSRRAIVNLLTDSDTSVRIAAIFAMYELGDVSHVAKLTGYLLQDADPLVRRNAAMILGRLKARSAVVPLAQAMKDADSSVRNYALEAMTLLGNQQAMQELAFMANTGVGAEEVFAIQALAQARNSHYIDLFRYKLANAVHIETRLAAAKGLGLLGLLDGFDLARQALISSAPRNYEANDTPQQQLLRRRILAASALGSMKQEAALFDLTELMNSSRDPRVQVSSAQAILQILHSMDSGRTDAASLFGK